MSEVDTAVEEFSHCYDRHGGTLLFAQHEAVHSVDELTVVSSLAPDTHRSLDRTEVVLFIKERTREVTSEDVLGGVYLGPGEPQNR